MSDLCPDLLDHLRDTINYVDKYGLRQGIWNTPKDSLMSKIYFVHSDNRLIKRVTLYPNKQIESELINEKISFKADNKLYFDYSDFNRLIEYYESGQKKRECYNDNKVHDNSYEKGKCKEWNEKGELVYEGDFRK